MGPPVPALHGQLQLASFSCSLPDAEGRVRKPRGNGKTPGQGPGGLTRDLAEVPLAPGELRPGMLAHLPQHCRALYTRQAWLVPISVLHLSRVKGPLKVIPLCNSYPLPLCCPSHQQGAVDFSVVCCKPGLCPPVHIGVIYRREGRPQ